MSWDYPLSTKWVYPLFIKLNQNGKGSLVMNASLDYPNQVVKTYTPNGEDVAVKIGKVIGKVDRSMVLTDDSMDMDDLGLPVYSIVSFKDLDRF